MPSSHMLLKDYVWIKVWPINFFVAVVLNLKFVSFTLLVNMLKKQSLLYYLTDFFKMHIAEFYHVY